MTPPVSAILENARQQLAGHPVWFSEDLTDTVTLIEAQRRRIAELENLTTQDELTGLSNRRGLNAALALESERIARGQSHGAMLVVIDLNGFKAINDTFGHDAGDAALRAVANTILGFIRTTDIAARTGGDEFVLLLTHTTASQMARRLQTLDQALNGLTINWQGRLISLAAAIGMAPLTHENGCNALAEADKAMYAAKSASKRTKAVKAKVSTRQRFVPPSPSSTPSSSERITA